MARRAVEERKLDHVPEIPNNGPGRLMTSEEEENRSLREELETTMLTLAKLRREAAARREAEEIALVQANNVRMKKHNDKLKHDITVLRQQLVEGKQEVSKMVQRNEIKREQVLKCHYCNFSGAFPTA